MPRLRCGVLSLLLAVLSGSMLLGAAEPVLWFNQSATNWTEALPLGNGNFGGCAGLAEMLLQSHERAAGSGVADPQFVLHLLPALPRAWPSGSIKGLRARGNVTVNFDWKDGRVTTYRIASVEPREVSIRVNGELLRGRAEKLDSTASTPQAKPTP